MQVPILPQVLEKGLQLADNGERDNSVLHVTDLAATLPGDGCPRQLWLRLRGADKKGLTAGQMLMFWHGKRIHQDLTDLIKSGLPREWEIAGVEVQMEVDGITGTADCLMKNIDTEDGLVVDYKTIRGRGFYFLNDEPKPAHKLQVQTYMYLLAKGLTFSADGGLILYVDREGQNAFKQFPVDRNDQMVKDAIIMAKIIRDASEPPPILEPLIKEGAATKTKGMPVTIKQPWQCDYCDYQDVSCQGALSYKMRNIGVVGHIKSDGFVPTKNLPDDIFAQIVSQLVEVIPF